MATVTVTEYTDPYCTWCWGSEPVLRHVKEAFGKQVRLRFVLGGLVEDIDTFYDPGNDIGGEGFYRDVAEHWEDASGKHGMPVNPQIWYDMKDSFTSTWPACKAVNAALRQSEEAGKRFLRRLREAVAAERRQIHKRDVQKELAAETGVNPEALVEALEDGSADDAFREHREECEQYGATGFPTFRIEHRETGEETVCKGYHSYDRLVNHLQAVADNQLKQEEPEPGVEPVHRFIEKYGKVAVQEVIEVFQVTAADARRLLQEVAAEYAVEKQAAGNSAFYLATGDGQ